MAYHQQQIMLLDKDRIDTNPRKKFRKDHLNFIDKHLSNSDKPTILIILGNRNKSYEGQSTSKKICDKFGLVDAWETLNQDHPPFSTYQRGTKRIDYALTTIQATHHIRNIRYKQYKLRMTGDHRGLIFDIGANFLFVTDSKAYRSIQKRGIISKDRKAVTKYLYAFHVHMKAHNMFERLTSLIQEGNQITT